MLWMYHVGREWAGHLRFPPRRHLPYTYISENLASWYVSPFAPRQVIDCLQTFKLIAEMGGESLGAYVISMAKKPSDVLAVKLLMKEFGLKR